MEKGPYKFTEKKRQRFLGCLRQGMRRGQACRAAGISRWTWQVYAKAHPEFAAEIEQAELEGAEIVEDSLLNTALGGNVTAQIFYLTNRAPERWKDRRQAAQVQVQAPTIAPEQLEAIKQELLKKLENMPCQ